MIHAINVKRTDVFRAGKTGFFAHGRRGQKLAVFPVSTLSADFTNVDFRVEVGRKRIAVITAVDVDDVKIMHFIEIVLRNVGGKHVRCTRVKTAAQQRCQARLFKFILVFPLPFVLKLSRV